MTFVDQGPNDWVAPLPRPAPTHLRDGLPDDWVSASAPASAAKPLAGDGLPDDWMSAPTAAAPTTPSPQSTRFADAVDLAAEQQPGRLAQTPEAQADDTFLGRTRRAVDTAHEVTGYLPGLGAGQYIGDKIVDFGARAVRDFQTAPAAEKAKPPNPDDSYEIQKGLVGGLVGTNPKLAGDAAEGFGVLLDSDTLVNAGRSLSAYGKENLEGYKPRVPSVTSIRTDGLGNFLQDVSSYAGYQTGNAVASSAPALAAGLPAGLLSRNPRVAAAVGSGGVSYIQNFGDVYGEARDDPAIAARVERGELTPKALAGAAAIAAVPMALLDAWGFDQVVGKHLGDEAKRELRGRILHGIASGAIAEGSAEGLQQVVEEIALKYLGSKKGAYEQFISVVDNALGGALGGGAIGGAISAMPGRAAVAQPVQPGLQPSAPSAPASPAAGPPGALPGAPPGAAPATSALPGQERSEAAPEPPEVERALAAIQGLQTPAQSQNPAPPAPNPPPQNHIPPPPVDLKGNTAPTRTLEQLFNDPRSADEIRAADQAEAARPNVAAALHQVITPSLIPGMEGQNDLHPNAERVLQFPDSVRKLDDFLAENGIRAVRPMPGGFGLSSVVLDAGDRVVRVVPGELRPPPTIPEYVKPLASFQAKGVSAEILPKLDTSNITPADVNAVQRELAARGLHWSDAAPDNLGRDKSGKLLILDGGIGKPPGSREAPVQVETPADLDAVAGQVAPNPTPAQRKAENFQMAHGELAGHEISIATAKGGTRTAADGSWSVPNYPAHYGHFKGTKGADGQPIDLFYDGPHPFVVDQVDPQTARFDEHKVVFANDEAHARAIYHAAFTDGKAAERLGAITPMSVDQLDAWLDSDRTTKPLAYHEPVSAGLTREQFAQLRKLIDDRSKSLAPRQVARALGSDPGTVGRVLGRLSGVPGSGLQQNRSKNGGGIVRTPERGPLSLFQFLASLGGIRDHGGELRSMDLHRTMVPGFGPLVRPNGQPLDRAREAAVEAGYLHDAGAGPDDAAATGGGVSQSTVADLLQAIDAESRGRKLYSIHDLADVARRNEQRQAKETARERKDVEAAVRDAVKSEGLIANDEQVKAAAELALRERMDADEAIVQILERHAVALDAQGEDNAGTESTNARQAQSTGTRETGATAAQEIQPAGMEPEPAPGVPARGVQSHENQRHGGTQGQQQPQAAGGAGSAEPAGRAAAAEAVERPGAVPRYNPLEMARRGELTADRAAEIAKELQARFTEMENRVLGADAEAWRKAHKLSDRYWNSGYKDAEARAQDKIVSDIEAKHPQGAIDNLYGGITKELERGEGHLDPESWRSLARDLQEVETDREGAIVAVAHSLRRLPDASKPLTDLDRETLAVIQQALTEESKRGGDPEQFLKEAFRKSAERYGGGHDANEIVSDDVKRLHALMRNGLQIAPPKSAAEPTPAGAQHVLPGAERISQSEQAQRQASAPLKPKVAQKAADQGLFSDESNQADLVDMARKPATPAIPHGEFAREVARQHMPWYEKGLHGEPRGGNEAEQAAWDRGALDRSNHLRGQAKGEAKYSLPPSGFEMLEQARFTAEQEEIKRQIDALQPKTFAEYMEQRTRRLKTPQEILESDVLWAKSRELTDAMSQRMGFRVPFSKAYVKLANEILQRKFSRDILPEELAEQMTAGARHGIYSLAPAMREAAMAERSAPDAATYEKVASDLRAELDRLGLPDIILRIVDKIEAWIDGKATPADGRYLEKAITIAMQSRQDRGAVLRHEAVHALRELGLFKDGEWGLLEKAAVARWRKQFDIDRRYSELSEDGKNEEAIADAYAAWSGGQSPGDGRIARLFKRIRDFLKGIGDALRRFAGRAGIKDAEGIFEAIHRGEVGRRARAGAAGRSGVLATSPKLTRDMEARHGDAIRNELGIEAAALTADEAAHLRDFRDADALRTRLAAAKRERSERLRSKGIREAAPGEEVAPGPADEGSSGAPRGAASDSEPKFSLAEPPRTEPSQEYPKFSLAQGDAITAALGKISIPNEVIADQLQARNLPKLARISRALKVGDTNTTKFRVQAQDKFIRWQKIQAAVEKATGKTLPEGVNVYQAESLYYGRTGERLEELEKKYIDPLVAEIKRRGLTLEQVDRFLMARHAPERNEVVRKINPDIANPSGMSDAEAKRILDEVDANGKRAAYNAVEKRVRKLVDETRIALLSGGLISDATRKEWERTYKNYVPLRGFADDAETEETHAGGYGKGFEARGEESKRALGRQSLADSPLGYAMLQAQQAIVRAEKAKVGRTAFRFVNDNPMPELWEINKGETKRAIDPATGLVTQVEDPLWRFKPNAFGMKIDGEPYYINFKGEYGTNLARALKNLGTANMHPVLRMIAALTRVQARLATSWNPDFMLPNFLRDLGESFINMQEQDQKKFTKRFARHLFPAMGGVFQGLTERAGGKYAEAFREFDKAGGRIRFFGMENVEDIKANVASKMRELEGGAINNLRAAGSKAVGAIEVANGTIENATRLAAFMAARDVGLSPAKAASIAREMTVNFNRKGELGSALSALYLFANAAMQGSVRMAGAMQNKKVRRAAYALAAAGAVLALYNIGAGGDDKDGVPFYLKIPPWIRDTNLIVMFPKGMGHDGDYRKIPLPYGYSFFHVIGARLTSLGLGKEKPGKAIGAIAASVLDAFDPLGKDENLLAQFTPSILRPVAHIKTNQNWTGRPLNPEPAPWNKYEPDSSRAFRSASPFAVSAAQKINEATGGTKHEPGLVDWSPGTIDYWLKFVTGGLGQFVNNSATTAWGAYQGTEWQPDKTPIVRRFVGQVDPAADRALYFEERDEVRKAWEARRAFQKDRDPANVARIGRDSAPEIAVHEFFDQTDKRRAIILKEVDRIKDDASLSAPEKERRIKLQERRELDEMGKARKRLEDRRKGKPAEATEQAP